MPEPTDPKDHYENLKTEIDGYIKYSHRWSIVWAIVYYVLRGTLIALAACVAAKEPPRPEPDYKLQADTASMSFGTKLGFLLAFWWKQLYWGGVQKLQLRIS